MTRDEALQILHDHDSEIREQFRVTNITLFGSFARDEARDDSDVDLMIEFDGPATFDGYFGLMTYLEDAFER